MATTPQKINAAIGATNTTLYTAFTAAGATRALIVSLHMVNTTVGDISVDLFTDDGAGAGIRFIADDKVVPAKGNVDWTGIIVIDTSAHRLRGIGSAAGVDIQGCAMENA